jgi:septal ring factor EnvC (AmiA/AmiB activator)
MSMSAHRRPVVLRLLAAVAMLSVLALTAAGRSTPALAASTNLGTLNSQLGAEQARQQHLGSSVASLSGLISSLSGQISLVQSREATVRQDLANDRAQLVRTAAALGRERAHLQVLRQRLARARMLLSLQLRSSYEGDRPDLVSVVLNAKGFNSLLEQITFLGRAEHAQQTMIFVTKVARAQATQAANQIAATEARDRQMTVAAAARQQALQGMNSLLQSRQGALAQARSAQQAALSASQTRANGLRSQIASVRAAQLAAQRAAARRAAAAQAAAAQAAAATPSAPSAPSAPAGSSPAPVSAAPSGGWAIPYSIVLCESGGQNLPPNSAGASGYYQIMPATWKLFGGSGPAAYLTGKSEQDAVASRIWNGGAGASNWVCAAIVGIH